MLSDLLEASVYIDYSLKFKLIKKANFLSCLRIVFRVTFLYKYHGTDRTQTSTDIKRWQKLGSFYMSTYRPILLILDGN